MTSKNIYTQFISNQYCVYHTIYSGNLMPPNYIGSSSVDRVLNKNYHGSVKSKKYKAIWKLELKLHPELFTTIIISYHDTRSDAIWKELNIQKIFNVVTDNLFVNMAYAAPNGFFGSSLAGEDHPNFGKYWSDDKKSEQSEKLKNFYAVEDNLLAHQERVRNRKSRIWTEHDRFDVSLKVLGENNPNYGNHWTEEQKKNVSGENNPMYDIGENHPNYGKMSITNGIENSFVYKNSIIPNGWKIGLTHFNKRKASVSGYIIVNNGIVNIKIYPPEDIPDGYIRGRVCTKN